MSKFFFITLFWGMGILMSCGNSSENKIIKNDSVPAASNNQIALEQAIFTLKLNQKSNILTCGDTIGIQIVTASNLLPDSIRIFSNDKLVTTLPQGTFKHVLQTQNMPVGIKNVSVTSYYKGATYTKSEYATVLSDIVPVVKKYRIKKVFPHDKGAFTQGLFYHNGYFYEATGLKGESSIRKVKPETGDIVQSYVVPSDIFGEGISMVNDKIFQISWRDHKCYVYDINTFNVVSEFNYSTEGWGLTFNGKNLIMSDGTSNLYIMDIQSFTVVSTLNVCDNKGFVSNLNELEFIDGKIFANIYQTDRMAIINAENGKVLNYIDLTGLLPQRDKSSDTDVLNGIAWDEQAKRLFVTGKKWPKLFEIEIL